MIDILVGELQTSGCRVEREIRPDPRGPQRAVCRQKPFEHLIEGRHRTRILRSDPPEVDDERGHVPARVRHVMAVPVDRHRAVLSEQDLTDRIVAMPGAQVSRAEPSGGALDVLAQPGRLVGQELTSGAEAPRPLLHGIENVVHAIGLPIRGGHRLESGQPVGALRGDLEPIALGPREHKLLGECAVNFPLQQEL